MQVVTAQLPDPAHSQDRVFVTDNSVIVLDGASAFTPTALDAGRYAQALGEQLADRLDDDPTAELSTLLADAIATTAQRYKLTPGHSPSSTVAILRAQSRAVDLLVLGDSPIFYGDEKHTWCINDSRMKNLNLPESQRYRERLRLGSGYDEEHRALLRAVQIQQRARRNSEGGYWIAETEPDAARHAIMRSLASEAVTWAVLATDGITGTLAHLDHQHWRELTQLESDQLTALLERCHRWEDSKDPNGQMFPRAKRHDDKTIATVVFT